MDIKKEMKKKRQPLIDTQEFLALSSFLNYQLSGEPINWHGILNLMIGKDLPPHEEQCLLRALKYLEHAYQGQKRRLGPLAILHPLRATALFGKVQHRPDLLNLLTTLLHDKNEDLTAELYTDEAWHNLQKDYAELLDSIGSEQTAKLQQRLVALTKNDGQKYFDYLGNLLAEAKKVPELASIKLADRLDNTLDLRVDLHDFTDNTKCYQILFDLVFLNTHKGFASERPHPITRKINGAMRLYQLYKNAVFLSLVRHMQVPLSPLSEKLIFSLAVASIREAQTILLHIFAYHLRLGDEQRNLLLDVMNYSHCGGFDTISQAGEHSLDGLFTTYFVFENKKMKKDGLDRLYQNKELMGQTALGFIIIFANFINDPAYRIRGIATDGIHPIEES